MNCGETVRLPGRSAPVFFYPLIFALALFIAWHLSSFVLAQEPSTKKEPQAGVASSARQDKDSNRGEPLAFKDCPNGCPDMIVVPAGNFKMGSPPAAPDAEQGWPVPSYLQHEVAIAKPFAIARYEVTYAEWDACVSAGACPHVADDWGRGRLPVSNVTWDHAQQFVAWLSKVTGKTYRLPSEAEWEYVARAGALTNYSWGDDVGEGNAACAVCGSQWDDKQAAPVGSFRPNTFGLFDLHGNVWEWVEDAWHDDYEGAPTNGTAWVQGADQDYRVVRGGGWGNLAELLRADNRAKRIKRVQFNTLGFRVAQSLGP
jgi:formylglycine-generating enzyme required for sulfatase activity